MLKKQKFENNSVLYFESSILSCFVKASFDSNKSFLEELSYSKNLSNRLIFREKFDDLSVDMKIEK